MYHISAKIREKAVEIVGKKNLNAFFSCLIMIYALFSNGMNLFSEIPKVRNWYLKFF